jgi:hypothetical protein
MLEVKMWLAIVLSLSLVSCGSSVDEMQSKDDENSTMLNDDAVLVYIGENFKVEGESGHSRNFYFQTTAGVTLDMKMTSDFACEDPGEVPYIRALVRGEYGIGGYLFGKDGESMVGTFDSHQSYRFGARGTYRMEIDFISESRCYGIMDFLLQEYGGVDKSKGFPPIE